MRSDQTTNKNTSENDDHTQHFAPSIAGHRQVEVPISELVAAVILDLAAKIDRVTKEEGDTNE